MSHDRVPDLSDVWLRILAPHPKKVVLLMVLISVGLGAIGFVSIDFGLPEVDMDIEEYLQSDSEIQHQQDAVLPLFEDVKIEEGDEPPVRRRLEDRPHIRGGSRFWKLDYLYTAKDWSRGILTLDALREIAHFEQAFRALPGFTTHCQAWTSIADRFCGENATDTCNALHGPDGEKLFQEAVAVLARQASVWWADKEFSASDLVSYHTRSHYYRSHTWGGSISSEDWLIEVVYPFLKKINDNSPYRYVEVSWYEPDHLWPHEVLQTLLRDSLCMIGSFLFVLSFLYIQMWSVRLVLAAFACVLLSFVASSFFVLNLFGHEELTLLDFVSVYLVLGIVADMVLIIFHAFRIAEEEDANEDAKLKAKEKGEEEDNNEVASDVETDDSLRPVKRIDKKSVAYKAAATSLLVTTVTTCGSFYSLCLSSVPVVRAFGFIMGTVLAWAYVLVMTLFASVMLIKPCPCTPRCCRRSKEGAQPCRFKLGCSDHVALKASSLVWKFRFLLLPLLVGGGALAVWRSVEDIEFSRDIKVFRSVTNIGRVEELREDKFADYDFWGFYNNAAAFDLGDVPLLLPPPPPAPAPAPTSASTASPNPGGGGAGGGLPTTTSRSSSSSSKLTIATTSSASASTSRSSTLSTHSSQSTTTSTPTTLARDVGITTTSSTSKSTATSMTTSSSTSTAVAAQGGTESTAVKVFSSSTSTSTSSSRTERSSNTDTITTHSSSTSRGSSSSSSSSRSGSRGSSSSSTSTSKSSTMSSMSTSTITSSLSTTSTTTGALHSTASSATSTSSRSTGGTTTSTTTSATSTSSSASAAADGLPTISTLSTTSSSLAWSTSSTSITASSSSGTSASSSSSPTASTHSQSSKTTSSSDKSRSSSSHSRSSKTTSSHSSTSYSSTSSPSSSSSSTSSTSSSSTSYSSTRSSSSASTSTTQSSPATPRSSTSTSHTESTRTTSSTHSTMTSSTSTSSSETSSSPVSSSSTSSSPTTSTSSGSASSKTTPSSSSSPTTRGTSTTVTTGSTTSTHTACPNDCSGLGVCDIELGACRCHVGQAGDDCSQQAAVKHPLDKCVEVWLLFGISGYKADGDDWKPEYIEKFDLSAGVSQEHVRDVAEAARNNTALQVREEVVTWVEVVQEMLKGTSLPFPIPAGNFTQALQIFLRLREGKIYHKDLGPYQDIMSGSPAKYARLRLKVNVLETADEDEMDSAYGQWQWFVDRMNEQAPDHMQMILVSKAFTRLVTEQEVLESTTGSFILSTVISFGFLVLFTGNVLTSAYAILTILLTLAALAFTLVVILQWEVGVVQAMGVTILVGMSVDYSFHFVQAFQEEEQATRKLKAQAAFRRLGAALVGGAVTTMGSVAFLLPCWTYLFVQLGVMIFANAGWAWLYTFLFLAPLLMVLGPTGACGDIYAGRRCLMCWSSPSSSTASSSLRDEKAKAVDVIMDLSPEEAEC